MSDFFGSIKAASLPSCRRILMLCTPATSAVRWIKPSWPPLLAYPAPHWNGYCVTIWP